jgi:hypothetical protein
MVTTGQHIIGERLGDLERTVDVLHGSLREVRQELKHARQGSLAVRLWRTVVAPGNTRECMSDVVCNRRIRPNTKVVIHAGATARS